MPEMTKRNYWIRTQEVRAMKEKSQINSPTFFEEVSRRREATDRQAKESMKAQMNRISKAERYRIAGNEMLPLLFSHKHLAPKAEKAIQPCPHCGSEMISIIEDGNSLCCLCGDCGARGPTVASNCAAVSSWNERVWHDPVQSF